jgi:hypothetical protein
LSKSYDVLSDRQIDLVLLGLKSIGCNPHGETEKEISEIISYFENYRENNELLSETTYPNSLQSHEKEFDNNFNPLYHEQSK